MTATKKQFVFLIAIAITGLIVGSCSKKKINNLRNEARELYLKSVVLNSKYIDSICNAPDSSSLLDLIDHYDHAITALNYSYPAGADYELAEGENDTLKNLSNRIISLRDSLLKSYAERLTPDSLGYEQLDSLNVQTANAPVQ
ncbi:MAG: hypothetical protein K2K97_03970 [Muribaculaceae bacterium]|nr:hypothetical protein [Muribaculaceae bacterium]